MRIVIDNLDADTVKAWTQHVDMKEQSKLRKVPFGVIQLATTDPDAYGTDIQGNLLMNYRGPFTVQLDYSKPKTIGDKIRAAIISAAKQHDREAYLALSKLVKPAKKSKVKSTKKLKKASKPKLKKKLSTKGKSTKRVIREPSSRMDPYDN